MSAWVKQISSQVKKYGTERASWYCEWNEPSGKRRCKSCGRGDAGKAIAERMALIINQQIVLGCYGKH